MRRLPTKLPTRLIALSLAIFWGVLPAGAASACACRNGCTAKARAEQASSTPGCCSTVKSARAEKANRPASCCAHDVAQAATACCCERPGLARTNCTDCGCISVPTSPAPARTTQPNAPEAAAPVAPVAAWLAAIPPAFHLEAASAATYFHPQPPIRILFSVWRN